MNFDNRFLKRFLEILLLSSFGWSILLAQPSYQVQHFDLPGREYEPSSMDSFFIFNERLFFRPNHGGRAIRYFDPQTDQVGTFLGETGYGYYSGGGLRSLIYQDIFFFSLYSPGNSSNIWISNGTNGGTSILESVPQRFNRDFVPHPNGVFLVNHDDLWFSDGSATNSTLLYQGYIKTHLKFKDGLVFSSYDDEDQLYFSDGTQEGTSLLLEGDFNFRPYKNGPTIDSGDYIFFTLNHPDNGEQIWKTDGTPESTELVFDPVTNSYRKEISFLGAQQDLVYFTFNDSTIGRELWSTDGTEAGTHLVIDFQPGSPDSSPIGITSLGDKFLFLANPTVSEAALTQTDGTTQGTHEILRLPYNSFEPLNYKRLGNKIVFAIRGETYERELWTTDGTSEGTQKLMGFSSGDFTSHFEELHAIEGRIWFTTKNHDGTTSLYTTDGTPDGLICLTSNMPLHHSPLEDGFGVIDHTVFFCMTYQKDVAELWKSDGTASGTEMVWRQEPESPWDSTIGYIWPVQDRLYGSHLRGSFWQTSIEPYQTIHLNQQHVNLHNGSSQLFRTERSQLLKTDGTVEGTYRILDNYRWHVEMDDTIYAATALNLFRIDPVTWVPTSIFESWIGNPYTAFRSQPVPFVPGFGVFFCLESYLPEEQTLYILTENEEIFPIRTFSTESPVHLPGCWLDDAYLFTSYTEEHGSELWRTDGTSEGTTLVLDLFPGPSSSSPFDFFRYNGSLVFTAEHPNTGRELWTTDGTSTGTVLLKDIHPGTQSSFEESRNPYTSRLDYVFFQQCAIFFGKRW